MVLRGVLPLPLVFGGATSAAATTKMNASSSSSAIATELVAMITVFCHHRSRDHTCFSDSTQPPAPAATPRNLDVQ